MTPQRIARGTLLFVQAFVAVTSVLGGAALVAGSLLDWSDTPFAIPDSFLEGSPFDSFVVPGLALAAWILVADASQGILTGALRGAADIWAALAIQLLSFWVICVPACYLLGQAQAQAFRNNYFDQSAQLWNEAGELAVTTHQVVYYKS